LSLLQAKGYGFIKRAQVKVSRSSGELPAGILIVVDDDPDSIANDKEVFNMVTNYMIRDRSYIIAIDDVRRTLIGIEKSIAEESVAVNVLEGL